MINSSNFLAACPLLADVPAQVFTQHCPSANIKSFPHGSVIYKQGQRLEEAYCVLDGQIKLSRLNPDGAEFTTGLLNNGDLFGTPLNNPPAFEALCALVLFTNSCR